MAKSTKTTNATNETEILKFTSLKEENEYYNQPVKIKLFKDSNKYSGDVFVGVNGSGMLIPRGVEVEVPRKFAEALKNSELQDSFAIDFMTEASENSGASELSE